MNKMDSQMGYRDANALLTDQKLDGLRPKVLTFKRPSNDFDFLTKAPSVRGKVRLRP